LQRIACAVWRLVQRVRRDNNALDTHIATMSATARRGMAHGAALTTRGTALLALRTPARVTLADTGTGCGGRG